MLRMNFVQPVREGEAIRAIKGALKEKSPRNFLLWVLGTNTGLRISDLLKLKVKDVQDRKGNIKDSLDITEQKTKRQKNIEINPEAKFALEYFFKKTGIYDLDEYLFKDTRKGKEHINKPISRVRAWQMINDWAREAGIKTKIGTHTLRKTYGHQAHQAGIDIIYISEALGHRNIETTRRYLGITQDDVKKAFKNFTV